jgi:hypothetical protein
LLDQKSNLPRLPSVGFTIIEFARIVAAQHVAGFGAGIVANVSEVVRVVIGSRWFYSPMSFANQPVLAQTESPPASRAIRSADRSCWDY